VALELEIFTAARRPPRLQYTRLELGGLLWYRIPASVGRVDSRYLVHTNT
jgi:hypothetical protein